MRSRSNWNLKVLVFLRRGENWSTWRKTSQSKGENQRTTNSTHIYGVDARIQTRATLVVVLLSLLRSTFWVIRANSVVHKLHANCFSYRRWLQFIKKVDSIHVESWFDSSNSAYYTGPRFIFSNINDPTTVFLYFPNVVTLFWTYRILETRR